MAAPADGTRSGKCSINPQDKCANRVDDPDMSEANKRLRVLLSEGSSTSGREALTILGLSGHIVEVCDPSRYCIARFSRFVRKFHHCPGLREHPDGYLAFVEKLLTEKLLAARPFDVLLPSHEQGFLFARVAERLQARVGLALPSFDNYRTAHSKAGFSRLLGDMDLPQPATSIVTSERQLRGALRLPAVIKTSVGTASRGVWFVRNADDLESALTELAACDAFAGEVLVQELIAGATEKAQSVFCRGRLIGFHAYRQIAVGIGGGEAVKESVTRPKVRDIISAIGERLAWHGAMSIDYLIRERGATPLLVDCNPRLVEPMNAYLSGVDLVGLLLRISMGETPAAVSAGREGVRTHLAMQALLGCAARGGTRRDLVREGFRLWRRRQPYGSSCEELTPVRTDAISAVPVGLTMLMLLASPHAAVSLALGGFGAHLLSRESIRVIESTKFD
jgi:predicted ATP-grasp superfamily ATP-dependent carboligase